MSIRKIVWNDLLLTGLKIDKFKYEILLPASYYMVYSGFESDGLKHMNCDIDYDIINSDKFNNLIYVVNLNMKPLGNIGALEFFEDTEEDRIGALNVYKRINASGNILICFNDDKTIENVVTTYISRFSLGKSSIYYGDEIEWLFNDMYPYKDFIAREQY